MIFTTVKKRIFLIVFFLISILGNTQEEACGTVPPEGYGKFMQERVKSLVSSKALDNPIYVPIQHHISRRSDGTNPSISIAEIENVMNELNTKFAPLKIIFRDFGPVKYLDDDDWNRDFNKSNIDRLSRFDEPNALNIYYFENYFRMNDDERVNLCGSAKFPGTGNLIVMKKSCSQNGSTTSHEVGHYFSLLHTHSTSNGRELVRRTNCGSAGDFFCDTPADPRLSNTVVNEDCQYTGGATDSNGDTYNPGTRNLMSYTRRSCRLQSEFTPNQQNAIVTSLTTDRAYLFSENTNTSDCSRLPFYSDFESGKNFRFKQNAGKDINWVIRSGSTPSSTTGPTGGSVSQYYMYVEASGEDVGFPNKTARLTSSCIDLPNNTTSFLQFDYHMYGLDMGELAVFISSDGGRTFPKTLWQQSGDKGNGWFRANPINLSDYRGQSIAIRFRATTGSGWKSDIAIDEIKITSGSSNDIDGDELSANIGVDLNLFPNPIKNGLLHIQSSIQSENRTPGKITITNILGKIVDEITVTSKNSTYDISSLSSGIYFVTIHNNNNLITKKFLKQ